MTFSGEPPVFFITMTELTSGYIVFPTEGRRRPIREGRISPSTGHGMSTRTHPMEAWPGKQGLPQGVRMCLPFRDVGLDDFGFCLLRASGRTPSVPHYCKEEDDHQEFVSVVM